MDQGRGLLALLTELSETAVQRGVQLAAGLSSGLDPFDTDLTDLTGRMAGVADDVVGQGKANTDLIVGIVRSEVDKAVARMGFVREEELAALRRHVDRLEAALVASGAMASGAAAGDAGTATTKTATKRPPTKKAAAKRTATAKAASTKAPAKKKSAPKAPTT